MDIDQTIEYLNSLLSADSAAIQALVVNRIPCNRKLAEHPTCVCTAQGQMHFVGLLGVINGMFGNNAPIEFEVEKGTGRILKFVRKSERVNKIK